MFFFTANAGTSYTYSAKHKAAYDLIISMRFDEAAKVIQEIKEEQPNDILVYHIENYIDFIGIFVSENRALFDEKEPLKEFRLAKLRQGNPDDPHYLFSQAELHLQWAMTRIKFKEYFTAAREVNKAIGMLERNQKRFPDFLPNKKSLSILHAVVGTLPDKYKGVVSLVSNFNGTIEQGLREITEVLEENGGGFFEVESVAIKAMIMLHMQNKKAEAWSFLSKSIIAKKDDPMATFLMASTAMSCGLNEDAIEILQSRTRSPRFFPFYYLDLMLGSAKLARLDNNADIYLLSYIKNFRGIDYYKDAYRKLAWHALAVKNSEKEYREYMGLCLEKGDDNIDEDKSALKEAKQETIPHRGLLKARILFDGGYLNQASEVLASIDFDRLSEDLQIEYLYRRGRVLQNGLYRAEAVSFFAKCIDSCQDSRLYYCCNSALQMGNIYEELGDRGLAEKYFKICLSMNPSEYKSTIHQKAKSGLNRINN
jgi:tetratricopeptide (TPR) repeat protein